VPPASACAETGLPYSEVTGEICRVPSTPFSQAPWYTLPVHLCRFRVRSCRWSCFLEDPGHPLNPITANDFRPSSLPAGGGILTPLPIGYGFRPHLRGPAHPARINLAQEPLDLRRQSFSLCLSLLMSAFSLPIPPAHLTMHLHWHTERSATTQMPDVRQWGRRRQGLEPPLPDI
jgi:hypothetical protein